MGVGHLPMNIDDIHLLTYVPPENFFENDATLRKSFGHLMRAATKWETHLGSRSIKNHEEVLNG